ncbi:response regulator transcription factor [Streptococcus suis]|uniref:response regulator transcription factor n=1 Tax=Streptococcus suis TaxID=1307 RepID=UPI000517918D|nr:response regulator transcription factor [Streptococcus suis]MCK3848189.1 response regulator transcription factor [Streptococcus suis]MCK4065213.1 response regulator transcription factor [Streptococcus suis]HEM2773164.1 response regulator transcription factor [Streptococcus suis]HEM2774748.1 response regulator transcription factor [Streptococcus suis]HEM3165941.1 response regulator transcription factor [Streptococcus suis 92-1400]
MMKKEKIYIVEDDEMIVQILKQHLGKSYQVDSVKNFRAVSQEVAELQPDLVLMDISLPYYNGFYWTTEIRKTMTMPIIFISSSDDEMNAVMAMNMGGDDFVSKPFSLGILDAKIAAFLRRVNQFSQSTDLKLDEFQLSTDGRFTNGEQQIQLSLTETKILTTLMKEQGQVVAKEVLLEKLWENEEFIDQNTLNVNMTRLRKKINELGFNRIHTVRGVGYVIK